MNFFTNELKWGIGITSLVFLILCGFIVLYILMYLKRKTKHIHEMAALKHLYEQELLKTQLEIQEETLKHISEEIHDNIGQVLSLAKLHLNVMPVPPAKENETSVEKVKQLVSKAISDLRHLSKSLHPDRVNELGLEENIRQELDMLEKSGLYKTKLQINGAVYKLPLAKQTIVFRIVQEGISNVLKHASASIVEIHLLYEPHVFTLLLKDNGIGFSEALLNQNSIGIGLRNMRNRSALIGGTFQLSNVPPSGTILTITIPADNKEIERLQ